MQEQTAVRHRVIVARLTTALGAFGILRIFPELLGVFFWLKLPMSRGYAEVLLLDGVLGAGALAAGWVLRRGSPRGWAGASCSWGAVAANSAVVSLVLIPLEYGDVGRGKEALLLLPRVAFYLASLLAVPYVLWAAFAAPDSGFTSRALTAFVLVLVAVGFWWTTAVVLEVDPIHLQRSWAK